MLYWGLVCFVAALLAGLIGFGGVVGVANGIAQLFFGLFLLLCLVCLAGAVIGWGRPPR
ncbi:MAG: DUF1328 domain-containing protein [Candidatus Binatia bacterium]